MTPRPPGPGGSHFNSAYEGRPPWDIGRPQPEFVRLEEAGEIHGSVLDVGCGTGENALFFAERGHEVWGIDGVERAIEQARAKVQERDIEATFLVGDALDLAMLGRTFDAVIDSGFFHSLSDEDRLRWTASLARALRPGGIYVMMCFSERVQFQGGPRRVTQREIRETFRDGYRVRSIREAYFASLKAPNDVPAWLAVIERTESAGKT